MEDNKNILTIPHLTTKPRTTSKELLKKRSYAFTMDLFIITLINKGIIFTYVNFLETYLYQLPTSFQLSINQKISQLNNLSLLLVFWGYFLFSYYMGEGRTPGKLIFGIKVHSPHRGDDHLSFKEAFMRTGGYFIGCFTGMLLLALPFLRKDSKGIPDFLSHTHIVCEDELEYIKSLEDHWVEDENLHMLFPEDPISAIISKENKAA
jgi:uncharacterized RDD family membrane protein YckC